MTVGDPWEPVQARLQKAGGRVGAALVFFLLLLLLAYMQRQVLPHLVFRSDAPYLHFAIGRSLQTAGLLSVDGRTAVPATAETLWQVVLAAGQRFLSGGYHLPVMLGACFGLMVVLQTRRLARLWHAADWASGAAILLAVTSGLALDAVGGSSHALSMLLVTLMILRYLESAPRARWPLPPMAAFWAGLAALVHLELLLVWLALALHAVAAGSFRVGRGQGVVFPLLRLAIGVLLIAVTMSSALAWNQHAFGVPWPRFPDAPMSLNAWSAEAAAQVWSSNLALALGALGESYSRAFSVPLLRGVLPVMFLFLGMGFTLVDVRADRERVAGTVSLMLLLIPLGYALVYPYVGWGAADAVFGSLQPAWAALIALGVGRSGAPLCRWVTRLAKQDLPWLSPDWLAALLLTLLALMGVIRQLDAGRKEFHALARVQADRERVLKEVEGLPPEVRIASDRIGWLACYRPGYYVDLTGRLSPRLLAFRGGAGWEAREAADYLRQLGIRRVVTWDEAFHYAETGLDLLRDAPLPRVSRVP